MTTPRTPGRQVAVRLSDVPLKVRRRHGARLYNAAVEDRNLTLALALDDAVERPSDRVYWLPASAVSKVLR